MPDLSIGFKVNDNSEWDYVWNIEPMWLGFTFLLAVLILIAYLGMFSKR